MPAPVVAGEGVQLVDHHRLQIPEQHARLRPARDEQHLDRLGRGQQQIGRLPHDPPPAGGADVAVPAVDPPPERIGAGAQPRLQVVQQRLDRADVEHAQPAPPAVEHPRQQREHRRLRLAAGGRRQQQDVVAVEHRADGLLLQRAERGPPERVDDVVPQGRVQAVERGRTAHGSSSTSSGVRAAARGETGGPDAARALRSTSVSSPSARVRA